MTARVSSITSTGSQTTSSVKKKLTSSTATCMSSTAATSTRPMSQSMKGLVSSGMGCSQIRASGSVGWERARRRPGGGVGAGVNWASSVKREDLLRYALTR